VGAGIWEEHPELGPGCMIFTASSSPLMSPIRDRMPALLHAEKMQKWLTGKGMAEMGCLKMGLS
jgi:putative SOS response-associated peptidase YedK